MMGEEESLVTSSVCVSQLFLTSFIFQNGGQEVVRERGSDAESFFQFVGENFQSTSPTWASNETSSSSSVLLFDVQRQGGGRHQPVAAAAARHHSNAAPAVSMEAASSAAVGTGWRGGRGRRGGRLLELLLVDFAFFGPAVLEPDLHLEQRNTGL